MERCIENEFTKPCFQQGGYFLKTEKAAGKTIYPPGPLILMHLIKLHST